MKTQIQFILTILILAILNASCSGRKESEKEPLELIKVLKKNNKSRYFRGEVYAELKSDQKLDSIFLRKASEELFPKIDEKISDVTIRILKDGKKVAYVDFFDNMFHKQMNIMIADSIHGVWKRNIDNLIKNKEWQIPDSLLGIWDVHGMVFKYLYMENGKLKMDEYYYKGSKITNKHPAVDIVNIDQKEFYRHVWESNLMGPDTSYYQVNEFGDLVFYRPHDFMQYVFDRIELE